MTFKSVLWAALAIAISIPPAFAIGMDEISDTRIRSAERLERVMPIEKLSDTMIMDHAQKLLPINGGMLADSIRRNIDWDMVREKNIAILAKRLTADELDYLAGENMTASDIRSGLVKRVMMPETMALVRSEIERTTALFEKAQAQKLGGFDIQRQSFLEYQAKNGIYYVPVVHVSQAGYTLPSYSNLYYSRMVK